MATPAPSHLHRLLPGALLLTLLLYLGGGVLAAGHLHLETDGVALDHACEICLLAAATTAAPGSGVAVVAVVAGGLLLPVPFSPFRAPLRCSPPPARAPPSLLN